MTVTEMTEQTFSKSTPFAEHRKDNTGMIHYENNE
jgi:hypothetical protein